MDKTADPSSTADMRSKAGALEHILTIGRQQTVTMKMKIRKEFGMKDGWNPLFSLSVDQFRFVIQI